LNQCPSTPPPGFDCPTCRWFAYGGDTAPGGEAGGYVNSAFFDYTGGVAAPATDQYHLRPGIYQANSSWGEHAGYSASIIGKKTALFAPFIYKNHHFTKTGSGQT
jgi:N-acetylglucosamine-6-sulfatase